MRKRNSLIWVILLTVCLLTGCALKQEAQHSEPETAQEEVQEQLPALETGQAEEREARSMGPEMKREEAQEVQLPEAETVQAAKPDASADDTAVKEQAESEEENRQEEESRKCIVIDAGHQQKGNHEKEPVAPGSDEMKAKVASGTYGAASDTYEYELTLEVSLKLEQELTDRGYQVIMVRRENDVNISNSERAQIANEAEADAFLRIHANGSENSAVQGMMTICPTADNPYCGEIYEESRALSESILDAMTAATGAVKERVWETDTMSGINWCKVPVTIIEMGYMTNREEDLAMQTDAYQQKIVKGIADGVDFFFADTKENLSE